MAITTIRSHVSRALDFFYKNDIYFAIGKSTPWDMDRDTPPYPDENDTMLQELIGYKKVEKVHLVVPDSEGTIAYRDSNWSIVSPQEALEKGARWVYLQTSLRYDELPLGHYRQVGVFSRVVPFVGAKAGFKITVSGSVSSQGTIVLTLNGYSIQIGIEAEDTLQAITEKIKDYGLTDWDVESGDSDTELVITHKSVGAVSTPTFIDSDSTGISVSFTLVSLGKDPVENKFNLLPSEVSDSGVLEVLDNRGDSNRLENQTEQFSIVIEF